ncbi:MAG: hypothetical protein HYT89_02880 [Candidatus Omnitrophica bacterium]|nr:hypothetical protein [Candidatus Omnitrophota bacterium]
MPNQDALDKTCSVCGSKESVEIETVTNVMPAPEEMFPVLLCRKHKKALQEKFLDITLDKAGRLCFVPKKKIV